MQKAQIQTDGHGQELSYVFTFGCLVSISPLHVLCPQTNGIKGNCLAQTGRCICIECPQNSSRSQNPRIRLRPCFRMAYLKGSRKSTIVSSPLICMVNRASALFQLVNIFVWSSWNPIALIHSCGSWQMPWNCERLIPGGGACFCKFFFFKVDSFFFKGGYMPFYGITDTPVFKRWIHALLWHHWYPCFEFLVTSPLGFKPRVGSLTCTLQSYTWYMFPEIHLWCNTCWPLDGQHGGWSLSPHVCFSRGECQTQLGDLHHSSPKR